MESDPDALKQQLGDPANAWSVGVWGALAEFSRTAEEPVELRFDSAEARIETAKGSLSVDCDAGPFRAVHHQSRAAHSGRPVSSIYLCLPERTARLNSRTVLTEIEDGLFDLGLGTATLEACIRAEDAALATALRAHTGMPLFAEDNPVLELLKEASPPRLFRSCAASITVNQPIGSSAKGVPTPEGPHTHILPKLLRAGRIYAKGVAIPDRWLPVLTMHPPHGD